MTRCSCRTRRSRPTRRRQSARQVVRGVPTRNKDAAPGGRGPPSDCKVQGRWSAASPTRNQYPTNDTRCSCRTRRSRPTPRLQSARQVVRGVPTRNKDWQVTRCSCRARRSRPTQRRQCARQVVRGVPTRNKDGRTLVAYAAPGGHGPPSDGNAQGRWSAASRRGTNTQRIRALIAVS